MIQQNALDWLQENSIDDLIKAILQAGEKKLTLTAAEVSQITGLSTDRIVGLIEAGDFPSPRLGGGKGRTRLWRRSDVESWVALRG